MKDIKNISEKYRKYLCTIKLDRREYFFIAGSDVSENFKDKLLLDNFNKLVLISNSKLLTLNILKETLIFDSENFTPWLKELKIKIKNGNCNKYTYALYDFDLLYDSLLLQSLLEIHTLPREIVKEYIDFVNLVDDYATQTNNIELKSLTNSKSVRLLWESYYDLEFWKKENNIAYENLIQNFNEIEFKIDFAKIYSVFISNFHFL